MRTCHPREDTGIRIGRRKKELLAKQEKYRELYANDLMTMEELKKKLTGITEELQRLDADLAQHKRLLTTGQEPADFRRQYSQKIEQILRLETVTNTDLRKIIDRISVNQNGSVSIYIKELEQ